MVRYRIKRGWYFSLKANSYNERQFAADISLSLILGLYWPLNSNDNLVNGWFPWWRLPVNIVGSSPKNFDNADIENW